MKVSALFFDWDNTLVDTWISCYESLNAALLAHGHVPHTPEQFTSSPHLSIKDSFPAIFGEDSISAQKAYHEHMDRTHLDTLNVFDGAIELLEWAHSRGIKMGLVSNKHGDLLRKEVDHLGWNRYFASIVGSKDTEADKPSHIPLIHALTKADVVPSPDVLYVGDAPGDVKCAIAAACKPVVVRRELTDLERAQEVFDGRHCANLLDVLSKVIP